MAVEIIPKAIARRLGRRRGRRQGDPGGDPRGGRRGQPGDPRLARARSPSSRTWGRPSSWPCSATTGSTSPGIGDSRAYRLRDGQLEQLTKDHSLADALLEAGTITQEELPNHKFKNVLYLYLGSKDARGGPEDVRVLDVRPGRPLPAGQRRPDRRRPRRRARRGSSARCDDPQQAAEVAQGPGPGERLEGQRHLPGHPRGRRSTARPRRALSGRPSGEPTRILTVSARDGSRDLIPSRIVGRTRAAGCRGRSGDPRCPGMPRLDDFVANVARAAWSRRTTWRGPAPASTPSPRPTPPSGWPGS